MRTKEILDRETHERQERTWIYMLHQQAPPPTRVLADTSAAGGFIPLAPLAAHAPSPLVAARAAAASLALHVNAPAHTTANSWPVTPSSHPSPLPSHSQLPTPTPTPPTRVFGGMVKLETSSGASKPSLPPTSAVFRSIISKPAVPEPPSSGAHVQRTPPPANSAKSATMPALMGLLAKRPRDDQLDTPYDDEEYDDDNGDLATRGTNGKRACLPKKCDFPMCKNSSRSRGFCYSHGGGRRCRVDNCANGAVSRDLCKRHGGGRRCRIAGCKSSSESGGLCYSHGGGRRCNLGWCNARAKKGGYCAAHVDNRNALPPVDGDEPTTVVDADAVVDVPSTKAATSVTNNQVIETLLALSKSPSQSSESDDDTVANSPTDLMSPRLANPYAIASILN